MKNNNTKKYIRFIFSFLIVFTIIFLSTFIFGLSGLHLRKNPQEGQVKVACVGDSVTYGHGVSLWHKNNYPTVLQNLLGDGYNVQNFGVSLSTVQSTGDFPYIETHSYAPSIEYDADILVFMLGSNDSKPYNWTDSQTFKQHYIKLLNSYCTNGNNPEIYLCTLARVYYKDLNQTSGEAAFDVQADVVDKMNVVIKEVATEYGYKLIDVYSVTATDRNLYIFDYVHPNINGAKAIAEEVYQNIK